MLDMNKIEEEIKKLEHCDCTSYSVCEKLAILYIVRKFYPKDENGEKVEKKAASMPSMMSMPD